ncbi:hypothetical protein BC940DRAFT_310994 [Gongronella butleri]|nr:hypothetical protein BC940DRAFT_310994 [Gongronella butleri]
MASPVWTNRSPLRNGLAKPPSPLFAQKHNSLSPRQVAHRTYSTSLRKLDQDAKRQRPKYQVRERLLLCHTMSSAEQFLHKRVMRTNRRVMALEEEEDEFMPSLTMPSDHDGPEERFVPEEMEYAATPAPVSTLDQPQHQNHHPFALPESDEHAAMDPMQVSIAMVMQQHQMNQQKQQQLNQQQHQFVQNHPPQQHQHHHYQPYAMPASITMPSSSNSITIPSSLPSPTYSTPALSVSSSSSTSTGSITIPSSNDAFIIPQDEDDDNAFDYPSSLIIPHLSSSSSPPRPLHVPPISSL